MSGSEGSTYVGAVERLSPGESDPVRRATGSPVASSRFRVCALCADEAAEVELSVTMKDGDRVAFPAQMQVGAECFRLWSTAADDELVARLTTDFADHGGPDVLIRLLRRRVVDVRSIPEPTEALLAARAAGYELLSAHTGLVREVGSVAGSPPHGP
jgi:hypothetical protein